MRKCTHRTACVADRQYKWVIRMSSYRPPHPTRLNGRENALEIGDFDGWVCVDLLVACCLALDVAMEELEEYLIAQDFGATHRMIA